jgi:hypothetical protein
MVSNGLVCWSDKPSMETPRMERRSEARVAAKERVIVTELGQRRHPHVGLILETAGTSLTLKLITAIACGAPVQVETTDMLMLGEVARCEPADGGFRLALVLRHSLQDLQALEKLNRVLMGKRTSQEDLLPLHIMRE